jgi:hypothetical protein
MAPDRLRELESGHDLSYLEGLRIAKAYSLCPSCFKRHFEGAVGRDMALALSIEPALGGSVPAISTDQDSDDSGGAEQAMAVTNEPTDTPYARAILTASR